MAQYLSGVQDSLLARGLLRTDSGEMPGADRLAEDFIQIALRDEQIAATRALDRVLLWQHYSIPNWHINHHRLAYRNRFAFVTTPPYTLGLRAWWLKPTENAR